MDIRKIEYFLKVVETLNFNAAAQELHISHQALSKQIKQLEEEVGEKLLERSTTNVSLTEIGRKVVEIYTPLIRDWNQAEEQLKAFVNARNHVLRLGCFSGLSYGRVVEPVQRFLLEQNPELKINMLAADMALLQELMDSDAVDLVLTHGIHHAEWSGVESIVLRTDPLYILVSEHHPWYQKATVTEDDLRESAFLVYGDGRPLEGDGAFFEELPVKNREAAYNLDSYMAILQQGEHFGIVGPSYTRREGKYKFLELPKPYRKSHTITAMYKKLHPQRKTFQKLSEVKLIYPNDI